MEAKLRKRLRAEFDKLVASNLPDFTRIDSPVFFPGERVYRHVLPSNVSVFLFLMDRSKYDKFTLEGAITRSGQFPAYCPLMNPKEIRLPSGITQPAAKMSRGQFRSRAGVFLDVFEDKWWSINADSLEIAAQEAVDFYRDRMLPLLISLAEKA